MELIFLQIATAVGVFLALITFSYLPYCFIQYRASRKRSAANNNVHHHHRRKSTAASNQPVPVLSLCNCFAAGVFLATCFLGMVPHVREHMAEWNAAQERRQKTTTHGSDDQSSSTTMVTGTTAAHGSHGSTKMGAPWTEILLIGGFLMVLLLEELIAACQHYCTCFRRRRSAVGQRQSTTAVVRSRPMASLAEDQPLMSDDEESGGAADRSLRLGSDSKPSPDSPIDLVRMDGEHIHGRDSTSINHDHHSHHHGGGGGHHHHIDASALLSEGSRSLTWRSLALLFGLGIHGVFEGVALGLQDNRQALFGLLFGVMSHEALCAIAFGINLAGHHVNAGVAFITVVLFSLSIPFGMVAGFVVNRQRSEGGGGEMVRIALEGLAAGTFVYVSFMDMLAHELAHDHDGKEGPGARWRLAKVLCVCAGFVLFLGLTFIA